MVAKCVDFDMSSQKIPGADPRAQSPDPGPGEGDPSPSHAALRATPSIVWFSQLEISSITLSPP